MQTMSFIRSLMEFNKRVLYQGMVYPNKRYTMQDLKNRLFFNTVFINNMQEVFEKYDASIIMDDYIECLGYYSKNVSSIMNTTMAIKPKIRFTNDSSFERRLAVDRNVGDQVITQFYPIIGNIGYKFINGGIYYISILENGYIAISFVDPRRSVYHDTMKCDFPNCTLYWKSDDCIMEYIKLTYKPLNTIAIKVTVSSKNPKEITKVEYNGNTDFMRSLLGIFPNTALIISNPYIYTDDIKRMIDENMDIIPPITKPKFEYMSLESIFDKDVLIEYPNDSFDEYLHFLSLASKNTDVKSIHLTLYRIGDNPAIFYILRDAKNRGIKVHVNIELCASGETINRMWAREMEAAGIKVTYYAAGKLKVHCKITMIKFNNGKCISQIGTGNYHTQTTTQYTDFSLITSDDKICDQVANVFKIFQEDRDLSFTNDLLVTRYNARKELIRLIDGEGNKGDQGYIAIKCNALDDAEISHHLDSAASKGCRMDLIVRGVCTWIPDQLGSTVKVKSIVWDKLEHSRLYCFGTSDPTIYLGSLDLVTKKIDQRIETLVKINDPDIAIRLCDYINRYVTNTVGSWLQTSSGLYIKE